MNGCSWEILLFITIYSIPVEPGVAQHSRHRARNKHKPNHYFFCFTYTRTSILVNLNSESTWGIFSDILQTGPIYHTESALLSPASMPQAVFNSAKQTVYVPKIYVCLCLCLWMYVYDRVFHSAQAYDLRAHISAIAYSGLTPTLH